MNEKMLDIYIKKNPEMQLIGSAIKLVLRERKRQDDKWGSNRNLSDMEWLTILTEEVGESAEAILKNLPEKVDEVVQITAVALAWLECILRVAEQRDGAVQPQHDVAELCDCGEPFPENGYCKFCGARARYATS